MATGSVLKWLGSDAAQQNNPRPGVTPVSPVVYQEPEQVTSTLDYFRPGSSTYGQTEGDASSSSPNVGIAPEDLMSLIEQDPSYKSFQAAKAYGVQGAASARKEALRQMVVRYGGIANLNDSYGDIDESTKDLAGKNEFSQTKQLERNYAQGVESFKRALAARGAMQSGDLQYGLDQATLQKGQSQYDLTTQFMSSAQKAVNDYVQAEAEWRFRESQAIRDAAMSVAAWWRPKGGGGGGTTTAPQAGQAEDQAPQGQYGDPRQATAQAGVPYNPFGPWAIV